MGRFVRFAVLSLLAFTTSIYARNIMGITIADSVAAIAGDKTVSGTEVCSGLSGTGTLTMGETDTLLVIGHADFTNMQLSDPTKGTIIVAAIRDSVYSVTDAKLTAAKTVLNNLIFVGLDTAKNTILNSYILGDSLTINGNLQREGGIKVSYFGQSGSALDLTVKGNFSWVGADRNKFYAGNNKFYGNVSLTTWFAYWGIGQATFEFAGQDTQVVDLQKSSFNASSKEAYGTVLHSGTGVLRIIGSGFRAIKFIQTAGTLDLNGTKIAADTIKLAGKIANVQNYLLTEKAVGVDTSVISIDSTRDQNLADTPWVYDTTYHYDTLYGFDTTWNQNNASVYAFKQCTFSGTASDSVIIDPSKAWALYADGGAVANYARIGKCTLVGKGSRGIAYNSTDAGGNTGWVFNITGPAFSKSLSAADTVLVSQPITLRVSPVSSDTISTLPVEWVVNGTIHSSTSYQLDYSAAATIEDNGATFIAYLKDGDTRVDSTGPLTLTVLDAPQFKGTALTGKTKGVIGVDTLKLTATVIAGVDSILWYSMSGSGTSATYTPVELKVDSIWTSGDLGSTLHYLITEKAINGKTFVAVGIDTASTNPLPSDTVKAKVTAYLPITILSNVQNVTIDSLGLPARFSISAQSEAEMKFQWFTRSGNKNTAIAGATDSVYEIAQVSEADLAVSYLVEISYDGTKFSSARGSISVVPPNTVRMARAIPKTYGFRTAYPNPFASATTLQFGLPAKTRMSLTVFDMNGRLVTKLINDILDAGIYSAVWHGIDEKGTRAATGQYIIRMRAKGFAREQRVTLVR